MFTPSSPLIQPPTKIELLSIQVDETRKILTSNLEKVIERGEDLDVLRDKADILHEEAVKFPKEAAKLRRKMCWEAWKPRVIGCGFILVVVTVGTLII